MFKRILGSRLWIGSPAALKYRGILMKANPDLHPTLAHRLQRVLPPASFILDLGAGEGALSARLTDMGYRVLAVDQNIEQFRAVGAQFVQLNFNDSVSMAVFATEHEERFDAVVGMEVIEHVENPWDYIRLLKRLVKPAGLIAITTPNVESWASRWNYLLTGRLAHFEDADYIGSGHINPVSGWELRIIAEALGLEDIQVRDVCPLPWLWLTRNLKLMLGSFLLAPFRVLLQGPIAGDITLCLARKPGAQGLPGRA